MNAIAHSHTARLAVMTAREALVLALTPAQRERLIAKRPVCDMEWAELALALNGSVRVAVLAAQYEHALHTMWGTLDEYAAQADGLPPVCAAVEVECPAGQLSGIVLGYVAEQLVLLGSDGERYTLPTWLYVATECPDGVWSLEA